MGSLNGERTFHARTIHSITQLRYIVLSFPLEFDLHFLFILITFVLELDHRMRRYVNTFSCYPYLKDSSFFQSICQTLLAFAVVVVGALVKEVVGLVRHKRPVANVC